MTDNTLNISTYNSTMPDTTSNSSTKSYTDKSFDFGNVFDNVSKIYQSQTEVLKQQVSDKYLSNANSANSANSDFNKRDYQKTNTDKTSEIASKSYERKNDAVDRKDTHELKEKNRDEYKIKDKTQDKTNSDTNKSTDKKSEMNDDKVDVDKNPTSGSVDESKSTKKTDETAQNELAKATAEDKVVGAAIAALSSAVEGGNSKPEVSQSSQPTEVTSSKDSSEAINVDLSQLPKDAKDINVKAQVSTNAVKVQPQTEQVLLNLKVDDANKDGKAAVDKNSSAEANVQAPLIQANADVVTNDNHKQSIKDLLEKSALTQDMLDKTNARVVSVDTSSSSSSLLNQQKPQEQGVKLFVESNSNLDNTPGAATQTNFAKTLDGVQQPKEIDKTDILSQIHTKLQDVKEEGTTKVTIVLKPESLGKINLELINGKDGLVARMTTENSQVKELLDRNLESLRSSLGGQGVSVNNVSVKVAETQNSSDEMFNFNQEQQKQANQQSSEGSKESKEFTQNKFSSGEDFVGKVDSTSFDEPVEVSTHTGQIDYKI